MRHAAAIAIVVALAFVWFISNDWAIEPATATPRPGADISNEDLRAIGDDMLSALGVLHDQVGALKATVDQNLRDEPTPAATRRPRPPPAPKIEVQIIVPPAPTPVPAPHGGLLDGVFGH